MPFLPVMYVGDAWGHVNSFTQVGLVLVLFLPLQPPRPWHHPTESPQQTLLTCLRMSNISAI